ncbi:MAG: hypothetical protein H6713_39500 [Myxococcales bacterium]|nr:hypothetical protein [Myxococcales bacterium]
MANHPVPRRRLIVALALFSAISAVAGGIELVVFPHGGNQFMPPVALLERTPFRSFLVPGLLLALVVGGASVGAVALTLRRSPAALDATILAGGALTVWIVAELALLWELHWLHGVYGGLGLALLGLGLAGAWRSGQRRHRWLILVTAGEFLGYMAPALAGIASAQLALSDAQQAVAVTLAGFVEGLALGLGQALALPVPVRRWRYAGLTSLGAGAVWASVMTMMLAAGRDDAPVWLVAVAGCLVAVVGLVAIGGAQWLELRRHAPRAWRWIPWTALAWTVALPLSFAPGPLVDESTPIGAHVLLWGSGGLLMAFVMAQITWRGARRVIPGAA